jgi:hypothetical protein
MILEMYSRTLLLAGVVGAVLLTGCGTSTTGPNGGSKAETMTGVPATGFPGAGQPKDAESPALGSSSEQQNSHPTPKVPIDGPVKAAPPNNP